MWGLEIKQADCLLQFQKEAEKFFHFCLSYLFCPFPSLINKDQVLKSGYEALDKVPLKIT